MVIDIWSLGCVFAELLSTESGKRQCFVSLLPFHPPRRTGARDHINLILDITGHTPGENDAWITNAQAKLFLRAQKPRAPADLSARYPKASPEAISLLREMLSWDPNARPSARECFRAPYWGEFRWSDGERRRTMANIRRKLRTALRVRGGGTASGELRYHPLPP